MAIEYRPGLRIRIVRGQLTTTSVSIPSPPRPPRTEELDVEVEVRPDRAGSEAAALRLATVAGGPAAEALRMRLAAALDQLERAAPGAPLTLEVLLGDLLGDDGAC